MRTAHAAAADVFSLGRTGWRGLPALLFLLLLAVTARAQELEPRAYSNLPTGLNFVVAAYAYSEGGLATDPSVPLDDANLRIHTAIFAYVRSLSLAGKSGKIDVIAPYSSLSGSAMFSGAPVTREVDGFSDPRFRLSVNFMGAPALDLREFAKNYAANTTTPLVLGGSLQVVPPLGQYDPTKLVNLGTNRWSIKPDFGFSKKINRFTFDMTVGVTGFSDNDNYNNGKRLEQDPIWSTQTNLSYDFGKGIWASFGYTYYTGGRSTVDGVRKDNELSNSRMGLTVSFPINRKFSLKANFSGGVSTRTGTDFTTIGLAAQYRWGAGL